jgi:hypothetical protein
MTDTNASPTSGAVETMGADWRSYDVGKTTAAAARVRSS